MRDDANVQSVDEGMTASGRLGNRRALVRPLPGVILAVMAFVAAMPATGHGQAGDVPLAPSGRDALWRTIFERPEALPVPLPTAKQAALGQRLFNDPRLSGDGTMACATCHQEGRAFTDGRALGQGRGGMSLDRNVPMLLNLAWGTSFFWDGRAKSLEEQARGPILAKNEMAGDMNAILAALDRDTDSKTLFSEVFPGSQPLREETVLAALAAYERTLISPKTRFDRWVEGDDAALSDEEREGFTIFVGKGGCVSCHGGWRLTDDTRHDIGLKGVSGDAREIKTPSLREAVRTAPYMHDGSKPTLRSVVDHYAGELEVRPTLANNVVRKLSLTNEEKQSLVLFLKTFSSDAKK